MTLLAEISSGNPDTADVLFLLGAIVFGIDVILVVLAGLARARPAEPGTVARDLWWWRPLLLPLGLGLVAIGWLVL